MHVTVTQMESGRLEIDAGGCRLVVDRDGPGGEKQGFRPVELLLAALGACTAGTTISFAEGQGMNLSGVRVELDCELSSRPERISNITMKVEIPGDLDSATRDQLFRVAKHCKIHNTLHREPEVNVKLVGGAEASGIPA
jgi:putative redox protein